MNLGTQAFSSILLGYLLGSLSPAYLVGRVRGYDVRRSGSGNAGASNTVIMAGKGLGLLVALADIAKAAVAWKLCRWLFPALRLAGLIGGVAALYGHMFPFYLRFHGGKGLACLGGICLAYDWRFLLGLLLVALVIAFVTNYVSVTTCIMCLVVPLCYWLLTRDTQGAVIWTLPAPVMIFKHRTNFRRIRAGEELRFRFLWKRKEELERIGIEEE